MGSLSSSSLLVAIVLLLGVANARMTSTKLQKQSVGAHEIGVGNLTSNVRHWRRDMAVMFYAPWCKYCKQLKPSWDQIAIIQKDAGRKNGDNDNSNGGDGRGMEVGVFDCDTESANTEICQALGVDRYPSIYFIGYGDFNQAHPGKVLAKSDHPRVVRYNADLYPDRIYDWVQMLAGISAMQRGLDNLRGAFGGGSSHGPRRRIANLESDLENSDYRMRLYADELERYKADEIFRELPDNGDPFPLLAQIDVTDEQTLPFRVCIVEYANEYCNVHKDESYCKVYFKRQCGATTTKGAMGSAECRPDKCPLPALGCRVLSACLVPDTIARYQEALAPSAGKAKSTTN